MLKLIMNRLWYILSAKTQYNIQSPFFYDLYSNVLAVRLDKKSLQRLNIKRNDRYSQLRVKLSDHYQATPQATGDWLCDDCLVRPDGSMIGMVRCPHRNKKAEQAWSNLFKDPSVTLSVDLFDVGLLFTDPRLSKQHYLFRVF